MLVFIISSVVIDAMRVALSVYGYLILSTYALNTSLYTCNAHSHEHS